VEIIQLEKLIQAEEGTLFHTHQAAHRNERAGNYRNCNERNTENNVDG
jgi:hypothetical protein